MELSATNMGVQASVKMVRESATSGGPRETSLDAVISYRG